MITMEMPGVASGHVPLQIVDDDPAKRAELAVKVKQLLSQGHAIVIVRDGESKRVDGYDFERNEWTVLAWEADGKGKKKRVRERIPAQDTQATVVPAQAGG